MVEASTIIPTANINPNNTTIFNVYPSIYTVPIPIKNENGILIPIIKLCFLPIERRIITITNNEANKTLFCKSSMLSFIASELSLEYDMLISLFKVGARLSTTFLTSLIVSITLTPDLLDISNTTASPRLTLATLSGVSKVARTIAISFK